jgi:polysaccharide biosynthesis/export protein
MKTLSLVLLMAAALPAASLRGEDRARLEPAPAADAQYRLGPEDVIQVFVWKEPELSTTITVRPDGNVSLPLIGELNASGQTAQQLQEEVSRRLRQYVSEPVVNVLVTQVNSPKFSVLGQVRKPDQYRLKNKVSVLDAIAMAGGFTDFANRDRVIVIRQGRYGLQRIKLDVSKLIEDVKTPLFYLQAADTVYVE